MVSLKVSMIRANMIDDDLVLTVMALHPLGALVTTMSKSGELQTRVLLYFASDDAFWKEL